MSVKDYCKENDIESARFFYTISPSLDFIIIFERGITQGLDAKIGNIYQRKWNIKVIGESDIVRLICIEGEFQSHQVLGEPLGDNVYELNLAIKLAGPEGWKESYWRVSDSSSYFGPLLWVSINVVANPI